MAKKQLQYQKIEEYIIKQIKHGKVHRGDKLPSENEHLCASCVRGREGQFCTRAENRAENTGNAFLFRRTPARWN